MFLEEAPRIRQQAGIKVVLFTIKWAKIILSLLSHEASLCDRLIYSLYVDATVVLARHVSM